MFTGVARTAAMRIRRSYAVPASLRSATGSVIGRRGALAEVTRDVARDEAVSEVGGVQHVIDAHAGSLASVRIVRVAAYRQLQPFRDGPYVCRGQSEDGTDSTIVVLESDEGLVGVGEMAPLGAFYAPAFAAGTRAGVAELAPALLGLDPREPRRVRRRLDHAMLGQPNVKSALDMAVHDLAARAAGVPLCTYLGGRFGDERRALPLGLAGHARGDGPERGGVRRCRLRPHPDQGRR